MPFFCRSHLTFGASQNILWMGLKEQIEYSNTQRDKNQNGVCPDQAVDGLVPPD